MSAAALASDVVRRGSCVRGGRRRPAADGVAGICCVVSVISSAPPVSARMNAVALVDRDRGRAGPAARTCSRRRRRRSCRSAGTASRSRRSAGAALAEHPAGRGEVPGEHPDLADIWLCHRGPPSSGDGKMPWSAMQKLSVRNGCMFRCAWLPPTFVTVAGLIVVSVRRRRVDVGWRLREHAVGAALVVAGRVVDACSDVRVRRQLRDATACAPARRRCSPRCEPAADVDRHAAREVRAARS